MSPNFTSSFDDNNGEESAKCNGCGSWAVEIKSKPKKVDDGANRFTKLIRSYTCRDCGATN